MEKNSWVWRVMVAGWVLYYTLFTGLCTSLTFNQLKILIRCHYSKARLLKIFPGLHDISDRCTGSLCHLTYMFFSCPSLGNFWKFFLTQSQSIFKICSISLHVAIFGFPDDYTCYTAGQLEVLALLFVSARCHLLPHWTSTNPSPKLFHIKYCSLPKYHT